MILILNADCNAMNWLKVLTALFGEDVNYQRYNLDCRLPGEQRELREVIEASETRLGDSEDLGTLCYRSAVG